jgi:hypothetical protein
MRYGATYGRIQEFGCNSPDYPNGASNELIARIEKRWEREAERLAKKETRIEAKVTELCKQINAVPVFQGDPRGNTIKIRVSDGYTNDWGREGICIPTS